MGLIYNILFRATVVAHFLLIAGNVASMFVLPCVGLPWYVFLPLESFLVNLMANPVFKTCPLTNLENYFRVHAGRKPIKGFIGHYVILPIRLLRRRLK